MNNEEKRNSVNKFELEGNVANISDIYVNKNGKKTLRFDLAQNNNGATQFVPIVLKGNLVDNYNNDIEKGSWVSIKGRISSYLKEVEKDGKTFKEKIIEILGFEVTDRTKGFVYNADGTHLLTNKNEMEK